MAGELLNQIEHYLNAQGTIRSLEEWLLLNLQHILDSGDERAILLANEVDADILELAEGLIDELTLRDHLQRLFNEENTIPVPALNSIPDTTLLATTDVETIRIQLQDLGPVATVRLDLVFV